MTTPLSACKSVHEGRARPQAPMPSPKVRRGYAVFTLHARRDVLRVHSRARAEAIIDDFIANGWRTTLELYNVGLGDDATIRARLVDMLLSGDLVVTREEHMRPLDRARVEPLAPVPHIDGGPTPVVEPRTWIAIRVVDQTGRPVPHAVPKLRLTDGTEVSRPLDADGRLRVDGFRPDGECDLQITARRMESDA